MVIDKSVMRNKAIFPRGWIIGLAGAVIVAAVLKVGLLLSGVAHANFPNPLNLRDLKPGQRITITFKVTVNTNIQPHFEGISNQARISGTNFPDVFTDDPDTSDANDPTETTLEPIFSMDINLPVGWSMISLPVLPGNRSAVALFPEAEVVYGFDPYWGYYEAEELNQRLQLVVLFDTRVAAFLFGFYNQFGSAPGTCINFTSSTGETVAAQAVNQLPLNREPAVVTE